MIYLLLLLQDLHGVRETCINYERLRTLLPEDGVGEQSRLNIGGNRCKPSRQNMPSSSRKRRSEDYSMNTQSKKSKTPSENVVNLNDDDDDDFREIDNYIDNDEEIDINMKEEEKEMEESTFTLKNCMELLNAIFQSKKINKDQYVIAVNILRESYSNRMTFVMAHEECRMEWLQSLFPKSM